MEGINGVLSSPRAFKARYGWCVNRRRWFGELKLACDASDRWSQVGVEGSGVSRLESWE